MVILVVYLYQFNALIYFDMEKFNLVLNQVKDRLFNYKSKSVSVVESNCFRLYDEFNVISAYVISEISQIDDVVFLGVSLSSSKNKVFALFQVMDCDDNGE